MLFVLSLSNQHTFMNTQLSFRPGILALVLCLITAAACNNSDQSAAGNDTTAKATDSTILQPAAPPAGFKHQMANADGINIHYVIGGTGEPLLLIHGFGQNWYMWNRLLPELSKHFTVIAPDLPGLGGVGDDVGGIDRLAVFFVGSIGDPARPRGHAERPARALIGGGPRLGRQRQHEHRA